MVFINHLLGRYAFFHGPDSYGHAVLITSADKENIFFAGSFKTHINISWNITTRQMTDMNRAICIGKGSSNKDAVVFFHSLIADLAPQGLQKYVKHT